MRDDPDPMGEEELKEILARAEDATGGPWLSSEEVVRAGDMKIATLSTDWMSPYEARVNALFLAAAREDVPRLVEEIRRLRGYLTVIAGLGGVAAEYARGALKGGSLPDN